VEFESPAPLPRALRALAHEAVVTEDGPHPTVKLGAMGTTMCQVILTVNLDKQVEGGTGATFQVHNATLDDCL
jgi:hypothetical protein